MILSLYYFLADGPAMIRALMRLSPLDDKYEAQLIEQFGNVTRAVVLATFLSALAQGILAGIGFYFAGVGSVFLLTVLAMLFAIIPFIGSAGVWVPVCLWMYFVDERTVAGDHFGDLLRGRRLDGRQRHQAAGAARPLEYPSAVGPA